MTDKELDAAVSMIAKLHYDKELTTDEILYVSWTVDSQLKNEIDFYTEFEVHADIHNMIENLIENGMPQTEAQVAANEYWENIIESGPIDERR